MNNSDILSITNFEPKNHQRMSLFKRSAQFAPFAALRGYGESLDEAARYVDEMVELSQEETEILDQKVKVILENPDSMVSFTYFVPDKRKKGGMYIKKDGLVKLADKVDRVMILQDGTKIPFNFVIDISGEIISRYFDD